MKYSEAVVIASAAREAIRGGVEFPHEGALLQVRLAAILFPRLVAVYAALKRAMEQDLLVVDLDPELTEPAEFLIQGATRWLGSRSGGG